MHRHPATGHPQKSSPYPPITSHNPEAPTKKPHENPTIAGSTDKVPAPPGYYKIPDEGGAEQVNRGDEEHTEAKGGRPELSLVGQADGEMVAEPQLEEPGPAGDEDRGGQADEAEGVEGAAQALAARPLPAAAHVLLYSGSRHSAAAWGWCVLRTSLRRYRNCIRGFGVRGYMRLRRQRSNARGLSEIWSGEFLKMEDF